MSDFAIGIGIGFTGFCIFSLAPKFAPTLTPISPDVAIAPTPTLNRYSQEPTVIEDCGNPLESYAGEYRPATNTIALCPQRTSPDLIPFVIKHEWAHWLQHRNNQIEGKSDAEIEFAADQWAITALLEAGDCPTIIAHAGLRDSHPLYGPGIRYSRQIRDQYCT